jgi:hypothetical protein
MEFDAEALRGLDARLRAVEARLGIDRPPVIARTVRW